MQDGHLPKKITGPQFLQVAHLRAVDDLGDLHFPLQNNVEDILQGILVTKDHVRWVDGDLPIGNDLIGFGLFDSWECPFDNFT